MLHASINTATSGDTTVVAAVASRRIIVRQLFIRSEGATNVKFKDGSTDLCGGISFTTGVTLLLNATSVPYFRTTAGTAFNVSQTANIQISGWVNYDLE